MSAARLSFAACFLALSSQTAKSAGDAGMEAMRAADQEAALAVSAQRLAEVRLHLQLALNCLEGRRGSDYRALAESSCAGVGAVNELPPKSADHVRVEKAIKLAAVGVTFHDFKPAHFAAAAVQAVLDEGVQ
jgi:hypothetical protein